MSKKNFVTIALSLNVIICVILCTLYFSGYGENNRADNEIKDTTVDMAESGIPENTKGNQETKNEPDSEEETDTIKEPDTAKRPGTDREPVTTKTQGTTKEPGTTREPATTGTPGTTTEPETTTTDLQIGEQTTVPAFLEGKTTAVITGDCNVRDAADVSSNVTGVTRAGEEYVIDRSKSTKDWIALVYNGSIGYIYIGYCTLK
ncbi:MAG: hypothetical protein HFI34_08055 [Lachnospiraceae bacterium]|nr:hypothetical protein [Lachnospiraceae bacterium]